MSEKNINATFRKLVDVMARLRSDDGCPWDLEQTTETLTPYIIEEAYELVEAIKEGDPSHTCEEAGDLLFQIVFQAQIAGENKDFNISDVINGIHEKMIRRHPHVFGDLNVKNSEEVRQNWVRIKESEGKKRPDSALGLVPRSLPSLLRGRRITENAAEVGFDWPDIKGVVDKFDEEVVELKESLAEGTQKNIEDEFGDVLFALVNLSRFVNVDPERALGASIAKFTRRFHHIEEKARMSRRKMEDLTLDEMEKYWCEAKEKEGT
jgi:tetrapyrrole methylase family protein / MazG family protein